jgi:dihydroxycyclohexadiene carboxylate dehydrogenase
MPAQKDTTMGRHAGKVAIVTGAAQGLGRAIARRLAAEGATLVLADRSAGVCAAALQEIAQAGGRAVAIGANLETQAGALQVVQEALARFGAIDIAVHNVGGTIWARPFWEYSPEQVEAEISRSLWPTLWGCHAVVPVLHQQGHGAIVNIGSSATRSSLRVPYAAAKGGVHALTVSLARDLAGSGVRVNCVSPGALTAEQRITARNPHPLSPQEQTWRQRAYGESLQDTPEGRPGTPDEIAGAVSFFASDDASYITGQVMFVAGGAVG